MYSLLLILSSAACVAAAEPVEFARDVVPALTRLGCNAGACHGSFQGRGGFSLSLLGFDPAADHDAIVKASRGRRILASVPERSLLLRKATGDVPHGGGKRLAPDSAAYRLIRDYIAQGLPPVFAGDPRIVALDVAPQVVSLEPGESVALKVTARWSDGRRRDVTSWALFDSRDPQANEVSREGVLRARRAGKATVNVRYLGQVASVAVTTPFGRTEPTAFPRRNYIDELVAAEWQRLGVVPASLTSDAEFLRRVSLDLIGTLPTPDEVRRFVASRDPRKRERLIDELLARPEYVDLWTLKWADLLRVHRRYIGDKGLGSFGGWLRRAVRDDMPLDRMAHELLTSQGNLFTNGPVAYYFIDQKPEELAETTSQLFLGVRLQCARCHHHPMEVWGQDDYYGLAAFFTRLEIRDNGDKGRFGGMQTVRPVDRDVHKLQQAARPRLFGSDVPVDDGDRRKALADWIVRPGNPFFARNFANRAWAYLMGRGLVEPIDDLRATNPASNPELLEALARDLAEHRFDLKHLLRTVCNSTVYQLRREIAPQRDRDGSLFTHRRPRRLPAEVLLDAINQATGYTETFPGTLPGTRAIALPDPSVVSTFLTTFGRPQRNSACECARDSSPDLLQALHLVNNTAMHERIVHPKGRVAQLLTQKLPDDRIAEELYLATLSRLPTEREIALVRESLAEAPNRKEGWEDVLWTLLNSPEFGFNH